jgi:hypothetical protein
LKTICGDLHRDGNSAQRWKLCRDGNSAQRFSSGKTLAKFNRLLTLGRSFKLIRNVWGWQEDGIQKLALILQLLGLYLWSGKKRDIHNLSSNTCMV